MIKSSEAIEGKGGARGREGTGRGLLGPCFLYCMVNLLVVLDFMSCQLKVLLFNKLFSSGF